MDSFKKQLKESYENACNMSITNSNSIENYVESFQKKLELLDQYEWKNEFNKIIDLANALSSPIRLKMLLFIELSKSTCFCELEVAFKFKQSTLTYHIKLLHRANLIHTTKRGKWKIFSINKEIIKKLPFDFKSLLDNS